LAGILIKLLPWPVMAIASIRSFIAAGVFLLYMRYEKKSFIINKFSLLGGIALSSTFISFIAANKLTTAANAIVLQYSAPAFLLIISAVFFHQKSRKGDIIAVCITIFGISFFFLDKLTSGYLLGNIFGIASGISFASMLAITGNTDDNSRFSGILLGNLFTFVIGLPFVVLSDFPITPAYTANIIVLGVFQLGIPYILYGIAVRVCSPLACALISTLEPLLNPVWVLLFYGEVPGFFALVGEIIVISTVVSWSIWSSKQQGKQTDLETDSNSSNNATS
jgi:drug/metabolite transporter (DMT)-like permease